MKTLKGIERAKRAIEGFYDAVCSVYIYETETDGKISKNVKRLWAKDIPCRIAYEGFPHTEEALNAAKLSFKVKMYTSPEKDIPEGSYVEIRYGGVTYGFAMAGKAAKYMTHQETELRLEKRWA